MFSCKYFENFKNTFFYRTTPVAASGKIRTKSLESAEFQFQLDLTTVDKTVVKWDIHRKIIVVVSIHIAIQISKHLNKNSLQRYVLKCRRFPVFTELMVLWNCFLNTVSVKNTSLFNFSKKKLCDNLTSEVMWHKIWEIRVYFKIPALKI